jgi:hypothetical protein
VAAKAVATRLADKAPKQAEAAPAVTALEVLSRHLPLDHKIAIYLKDKSPN